LTGFRKSIPHPVHPVQEILLCGQFSPLGCGFAALGNPWFLGLSRLGVLA
jgi:hypothetical protein